jgi:hypothetical protein
MGILDFLFEGAPPASTTTYGSTSNNVPTWLSDYTQGIIARANAEAANPYQPFGGPRIAPFTPDQLAAQGRVRDKAGSYSQPIEGAIDTTQDITGQASGIIGQNLAGAGRTFTGDNVQTYMNPYIDNVINRQKEIATRAFNEELLPTIQNTFTRNGQYGSTRMAQAVGNAANRTTQDIQSAADAALSQGYGQAADIFASDTGRQGMLGQLGIQGGLEGAKQSGMLGETLQGIDMRDTAALDASGAIQQQFGQKNLDLARSDFEEQRDYDKNQLNWLAGLVKGIPQGAIPSSTTTTSTGPASEVGPTGIEQIGSIATAIKGIWDMFKGQPATGSGGGNARGGVIGRLAGGRV